MMRFADGILFCNCISICANFAIVCQVMPSGFPLSFPCPQKSISRAQCKIVSQRLKYSFSYVFPHSLLVRAPVARIYQPFLHFLWPSISYSTLTDATSQKIPPNMSTKPSETSFIKTFFNNTEMGQRYKNAEVVTAPFGRHLIEKAGLLSPNLDSLTILDNACGTGVMSAALHEMLPTSTKSRMKLTMGDFSETMLKIAKERCASERWMHTEGKIVDAQVCTIFAIVVLRSPRTGNHDTRWHYDGLGISNNTDFTI